jgi:hypothetical protein
MQATGISFIAEQEHSFLYVGQRLGFARSNIVHANISRMVYDRGKLEMASREP